jgi:hypothetical protein
VRAVLGLGLGYCGYVLIDLPALMVLDTLNPSLVMLPFLVFRARFECNCSGSASFPHTPPKCTLLHPLVCFVSACFLRLLRLFLFLASCFLLPYNIFSYIL